MTIYDSPFDPNRPLDRSGCICGRHRSPAEHDQALAMQCQPVVAQSQASQNEEKTYERVVASAVLRFFTNSPVGAKE